MTSKTAGEHSFDLQKKADDKINSIDLQREIHKGNREDISFEDQVRIAVENGKEDFEGDFFPVVLFKRERLLKNIIRQYFFTRQSCPTPEYDQVVYKYFRKEHKLDFLWVVPDKQTVIDMCMIGDSFPKEHQDLVSFAKDFNTGELDKLCDRLNTVS